jgi:hypothetical protein
MNEKREFRLTIINNLDVLGLSDMVHDDKYLFTVETNSNKGEYYALESKVYKTLSSFSILCVKRNQLTKRLNCY